MADSTDYPALAREAYESFMRGDIAKFTDAFTDDTLVIEAESLPYGGEYRGASGWLTMLDRINDVWRDLSIVIDNVSGDGNMAVVCGFLTATGKATGMTVTMRLVEIWTFENGKLAKMEVVYGDTALARRALGLNG